MKLAMLTHNRGGEVAGWRASRARTGNKSKNSDSGQMRCGIDGWVEVDLLMTLSRR